jgi:putative peptide zinc metalloprotease protein
VCLSSTLVTLLLNGNPLMRYDGYYVMSDWLGISNLSERAREHASRWLQSWMPHRDAPNETRDPLYETHDAPLQVSPAMVWYHAASVLYRWFVVAGLLLAVRSACIAIGLVTPHPTVWIGLMAIAALGIGLKHAWKAQSRDPGWRRRQRWIWFGLAWFLAVILLIPIPQFHTARGVLQPIDTHPIHARASAFLVECLPDGTDVQAGDVVMRLDSPELRQLSLQIEGEWTVLASRIEQLQRRAVDDPVAPTMLAEALQQREGLRQRRTEFGQELEKLVVRSPVEGRLVYARDLKSNYPGIAAAIDSGLPLHELAKDRFWLERGMLLAYVQPLQVGWALQATLAETQLASVHPGMLVAIRLDQSPRSQWAGSIDRIEVIPEGRREATNKERSFQNLAERKEWMAENRILGVDFRVTVWIRGHGQKWHRDGHGTLSWRGYSVSGWEWLGSKFSAILAFGSETRNLEPFRVVESSTRTEPFRRWTIERTRNSPSPVPGFFLSSSSPAR